MNIGSLGLPGFGAVALGAAVLGWLELVQRYRENDGLSWRCRWVWAYLIFNVVGCLVAFGLLRTVWHPADVPSQIAQIATVSVGSWGAFRAYLPHTVGSTRQAVDQFQSALRVFLKHADAQIANDFPAYRRRRGQTLMKGIPFGVAVEKDLRSICLRLASPRPSDDREAELSSEIDVIEKKNYTPDAKDKMLAYALVEHYGLRCLAEAVRTSGLRPRRLRIRIRP